jgi:hypothetical protein
MSRHQWQPAEGQIVNVEEAHGRHELNYTIEARKADGALIRRTVKHKEKFPYEVGTTVRIEISQDNEIRFDPVYTGESAIISTMSMTDQIQAASSQFTSFDSFDGSGSGSGLGSGSIIRMVGPDGRELDVDTDEVATLFEAIISEDPVAKEAASARLAEIQGMSVNQITQSSQAPKATPSVASQLEVLQTMLDAGLFSQAEFDTERQRLLGGG